MSPSTPGPTYLGDQPLLPETLTKGQSIDQSNNTLTKIFLNHTLIQDDFPGDMDLTIYADNLALSGKYFLFGQKTLRIVARNLMIGKTVSFDLSGSNGEHNYQPGDAPPVAPQGKPGTNGNPGSPGKNGGKIFVIADNLSFTNGPSEISVNLNGGNGGRGQDGGQGGEGNRGKSGDNAVCSPINSVSGNHLVSPASNGKTGFKGETGGNGGAGGNAGSGGQYYFQVFNGDNQKLPFSVTVLPGKPGAGGSPGAGGHGGPGGQGGKLAKTSVDRLGFGTCFLTDEHAPDGTYGPTGSAGAQGNSGGKGIPGNRIAYSPDLTVFQPLTSLVLKQAEVNYLFREYKAAQSDLLWLTKLYPPAPTNSQNSEYVNRIDSLLNQLKQGLNYYGQPHNHVPIESLATYGTTLPNMLSLANEIENNLNYYIAAAKANKSIEQQINTAITHAQATMANLQGQLNIINGIGSKKGTKQNVADAIDSHTTDLIHQKKIVESANQQFINDVVCKLRQNNGGCKTIEDVINILTSIAVLGAGSITGIQGIVSGIEGLANQGASFENEIKQLEITDGSLMGIIKANSKNQYPNQVNAFKMLTSLEEFDHLIQPYINIQGAQNFETQVNNLFGIIQTLNQNILEYNRLQFESVEIESKINLLQTQISSFTTKRSKNQDPALYAYTDFLLSIYELTVKRLIREVFSYIQAYNYLYLQNTSLSGNIFPSGTQNFSLSALDAQYNSIQAGISNYLNGDNSCFASPPQPFDWRNPSKQGKDNQWVIDLKGNDFENFKEKGQHTFTIPLMQSLSNMEGKNTSLTHIQVTDFNIEITGIKGTKLDNGITIDFIHSGRALFLGNDGKTKFLFSHKPVLASIQYNPSGSEKTAGGALGGGDYIALSPFTTWTIKIEDPSSIEYKKDSNVKFSIGFKGQYIPLDNNKVEK